MVFRVRGSGFVDTRGCSVVVKSFEVRRKM